MKYENSKLPVIDCSKRIPNQFTPKKKEKTHLALATNHAWVSMDVRPKSQSPGAPGTLK
jgi:hypothetical protein